MIIPVEHDTEALLPYVRVGALAHREDCASVPWFWWGATGGATALSDVGVCSGCAVMFWSEGLAWVNWDDPVAEEEVWLCDCCATAAGHLVTVDARGVHPRETIS